MIGLPAGVRWLYSSGLTPTRPDFRHAGKKDAHRQTWGWRSLFVPISTISFATLRRRRTRRRRAEHDFRTSRAPSASRFDRDGDLARAECAWRSGPQFVRPLDQPYVELLQRDTQT